MASKVRSPFNLTWLTVNRGCNFRCAWCYASGTGYHPADDMPLNQALLHVRLAKQLGTKKIYILGGEPTLWPHLFETADALREAGIRSVLVSNAYRFAEDNYWESYLAHPCDAVGPSIKGFDSKSLVENTGVRDFVKATKGLRRVCDSHKNTILSFVYANAYAGHLTDMVRYAMDCGAFGVSVNFCAPAISARGVDARCVVPVDQMMREVLSTYEELHTLTNGRLIYVIKHPLCIFPREFINLLKGRGQISTTCHLQHRTGCVIGHDGSVTLCNHMADFPIGRYGEDYTDGDSLSHFFSSPAVQGVFDQMNAYPSLKCAECSVYEDCAGGCPILWTHHTPDDLILGWDPGVNSTPTDAPPVGG